MNKNFKITGCHDCKFRSIEDDHGSYYCQEIRDDRYEMVDEEYQNRTFHKDCPYIGKEISIKFERPPKIPRCGDCKLYEKDDDYAFYGYCGHYSEDQYRHLIGRDNKSYKCGRFELSENASCDTCKTCCFWRTSEQVNTANKVCCGPTKWQHSETGESSFCYLWKGK